MTELFQDKYRISSARLIGWDYGSSAYYLVTICTHNRVCHFGDVLTDDNHEYSVALSPIGKIALQCWLDIPKHFPDVSLDEWVIMPNHAHGIIVINRNKNQPVVVETQNFASLQMQQTRPTVQQWTPNRFGPQSRNLASIIRGFKIGVTKYARNHNIDFAWQARYYDRIIRNENALHAVRHYIKTNPDRWHRDRNNIENIWY